LTIYLPPRYFRS
ncbi:unnamed protein product, partial [Rotaria sp. Silwood1]